MNDSRSFFLVVVVDVVVVENVNDFTSFLSTLPQLCSLPSLE